jgi:hypothetical protein
MSGNRKKIARKIRLSTDIGYDPVNGARAAYRFGDWPSSPSSAIDSRIDESAWMFFMR